jgi:DNA-binding NarL/FixJ family response regulator
MQGRKSAILEKQAIRILLVDDHPLMRRGIRDALSGEKDLQICAEAGDISSALRMLESIPCDLVLIDLSLGQENGIDLIREVKARYASAKVLVFSIHDDSLYAERVLRAGALGYINKSQPPGVLVGSIRKAMAGETVLSSDLTEQIVKRVITVDGPSRTGVANLSNRELQIFDLVGQGVIVREIAEQLCVSVKTVESHIEHIKTKLGVKSSRELVRHAALWRKEQEGEATNPSPEAQGPSGPGPDATTP